MSAPHRCVTDGRHDGSYHENNAWKVPQNEGVTGGDKIKGL